MERPILETATRISNGLLWLFTTPWGQKCLLGFLSAVFLLRFFKAWKERSLLLQAAGKRRRPITVLDILVQEAVSVGGWVAANIPLLIGLAAVLSIVIALAGTVTKVDEYLALQQKIREYTLVLKNLDRRYKVAYVQCIAQEHGKTTLKLSYFDQNGAPVKGREEEIKIEGADIFIDALVINFAYSGIESGERRNLALPYRIFSDRVPQREGIPLKITGGDAVPFYFEREAEQVFGLEKSAFDTRLTELLSLARDAERARKAGLVRSVYGNAVHRVVSPGEAFFIWVEQSGGLTIKDEGRF